MPLSNATCSVVFALAAYVLSGAALGNDVPRQFEQRADRLVDELLAVAAEPAGDTAFYPTVALHVQQCRAYPYGAETDARHSHARLLADLADGLRTGLSCLAGNGPAGRLHPYHERQAERLLSLFDTTQVKTIKCVDDAMFATAVATGPHPLDADDPLFSQLSQVDYPAIIVDTHRLGGLLSRRFDDQTYREFFHLDTDQIIEHRNGQPLRAANLHRFEQRDALLFHEVVHWLGHEHSALYPDVAHLYETCCFGGSDFIADTGANRRHQQTACDILKDDDLWLQQRSRYHQMRLWHDKGYDTLKTRMRADYAD